MSRLSLDSNFDPNDEATPSWADGAPAIEPIEEEDDEAERTFSRRRSLECSAVVVSIVGTESTQGHTLYIIQVSSGIKQWEVARRFRDFCYLDKQLRKNFPKLKIPTLPPKQYLFSSTSTSVVDERRNQLETYLKSLIYMQSVWSRNDLALFLNNDSNSMMFIWNFERMRKMQDMLSSMTVENEHETTKLTTDLTLAKTQVQALQERLSRMEMLLLQQATGMASEELSPNAIRSLSGMGMDRALAQRLAREIDEDSALLYGEPAVASPPRKGSLGSGGGGEASYATHSHDEEGLNPLDQAMIEDAIQAHVTSGQVLPPSEVVQVLSLATQETTPAQSKTLLKNLKGKTPEQVRALAVSLQLQEALRISNEVLNEKFDILAPDSARRSESGAVAAKVGSVKTPATFPMSAAESVLFAHDADAEAPTAPTASAWATVLCGEIDEIVQVLTPTEASIQARYKIFRYVRDLVSNTLGVQLFPIGAFVSHTYLPDGDVDASAFLCKNENDTWFVKVNEALCMSSFSHGAAGHHHHHHPGSKHSSFDTLPDPPELIEAMTDEMAISNVGFVNGDVKKIKIMINNIAVDISMNQIGSLYAQFLVETVDKFVGKNHLFKRSMLLVEAWSRYESPRHTQGGGSIITGDATGPVRLSPWTVSVMLIWTFNSEGARITSPVQALGHFLRLFVCFDWSKYALTVKGPVNASDLSAVEGGREDLFFPAKLLDKFSCVEDELASFRLSHPPAAPAAVEESIMIGEVVVKIDTTQKVEGGRHVGASEEGEGSTTPPPPPAPVDTTPPAPMSKANSAAMSSMVTERDAVYVQGLVNIIDPAAPDRNLVQGLDVEGYQVLTSALYEGYKQFQGMCEAFARLQQSAQGPRPTDQEVTKVLKQLLINTQLKVIGWNPNFKKKPGQLSLAFGSHQDLPQQAVESNPNADLLLGQFDELDFSLRYAEMVLGGRVDHRALIKMIIRVLMHKGAMPVGEVGKNLQIITGSDILSRRLKEQFGGLKKAVEISMCPRLRMGTEHPFNPLVHLVPESQIPGWSEASAEGSERFAAPALGHHAYVYIPVLAALALAAREKEALAAANSAASSNSSVASGKSGKSFRRQPPFYLDNMSVSSRSTWANARRGSGRVKQQPGASPRIGGSSGGGGGGGIAYGFPPGSLSPMHQAQYTRAGAPIMMAQSPVGGGGVLPGPFPGMVAVPVGNVMGSPQQGVNMAAYAQMQQMQLQYMQQQQQMYQNYQAQMHPSMANSLSSSYGTLPHSQSPMSHSPMANYQAYMTAVTSGYAQQQQQPPQPQQGYVHGMQPISPKGNIDQHQW